jgi:hypothetical protein
MKTQMLRMPIAMISKLVEKVHFDPDKPENHNLMILNKKEGYVSIFQDDKWHYRDKDETIRDLVDGKYYILDSHYDKTNGKGLTDIQRKHYEEFRDKFDSNDKEIHKLMNKKCEMTILNSQKNIT